MLKVVLSTNDYGDAEPSDTQFEFYFAGRDIGGLNLDDDQTVVVLRVLTAGGADIHDLRDRRIEAPVTPP